ncbi:MAG: hypothetical protein DYH04_16530 [Nitrospira sp. NTP2]|nr:hypothetical protein [Nitrospira sp. NTP2]RIK56591.1 MAG: hypothetical protein DCC63_16805 [Nitrospira sp.]
MVQETFVDFQADTNPVSFSGWRCIVCGAIVDTVIARHQVLRPQPRMHHTRARKPLLRLG